MANRATRRAALATLAVLLSAAGCGFGPKVYHLSGSVTFDGKPLPKGVIFFDPDPVAKNDGPQGYAIITDGRYSTAEAGGRGVVGGAYIARIDGFDGKPGHELPLGRPVFSNHQEKLDLPRSDSTRDFAVPKSKGRK